MTNLDAYWANIQVKPLTIDEFKAHIKLLSGDNMHWSDEAITLMYSAVHLQGQMDAWAQAQRAMGTILEEIEVGFMHVHEDAESSTQIMIPARVQRAIVENRD